MSAALRVFSESSDSGKSRSKQTTVADVIDWFLARYTSTSREAVTEIHRVLKLFCKRYGPMPVDSMIGDNLVSFVAAQPKIKRNHTIARWYRTIRQPFNLAERMGTIRSSPFKGVKLPRGDRGRDMTDAEFRLLLRNSHPSFRRVLIFLRYSGARPGELRKARWEDVNWTPQGAVIVLRRHKTTATQREPRPRKIVLPASLTKMLMWLRRRATTDVVFINSEGNAWTMGHLCAYLRWMRRRLGLPEDLKPYSTRHAFGTGAVLNGVDIATLAELMGHTSTHSTEWYLHLSGKADHLKAAVEQAVQRHAPAPRQPVEQPKPVEQAKPADPLPRWPEVKVKDGAAIRKEREAAGLTQGDFAARLGVTREHLNRIENGTVHVTSNVAMRSHLAVENIKKRKVVCVAGA